MKKLAFILFVLLSTTAFAQNSSKVVFNRPIRMLQPISGYKMVDYELTVTSKDKKTVQGPFHTDKGMQTMHAAKALGKAKPGDEATYKNIKLKEVNTGKEIDAGNFTVVL